MVFFALLSSMGSNPAKHGRRRQHYAYVMGPTVISLLSGCLLAACRSHETPSCATATEGCACYGNGTCEPGFACSSDDVCAPSDGSGGADQGRNGQAGDRAGEGSMDAGRAGAGGSTAGGGASGSGASGSGATGSGAVGGSARGGANYPGSSVSPDGGAEPGVSFDHCPGFSISNDGVLDLNLRAIHVSGTVTLKGLPLPTEAASRGTIVFEDTKQGARASWALETTGASTYSLVLPPGVYDVRLEANAELCAGTTLPQMPCGGGVLRSAIDLRADGVLDIDIPVARVSGTVTLEGATFADDSDNRGALQFTGPAGASLLSKPFGSTGAVTYSLTLLPGRYDIGYVGNPALCQKEQLPHAPCNSGVLRHDVDIASGVLDVDVGAVQIRGAVTLGGAVLPDETMNRGSVTLSLADGSTVVTRGLGEKGRGTYAAVVLPGVYDVGFAGNPQLCTMPSASHVPCNAGTVLRAMDLATDGVVDVDLSPVTVSGAVTLNGAVFPDEAGDRGALTFGLVGGTAATTRPFGSSGPAMYQITLLSGDYDVVFAANAALCTEKSSPRAPCVSAPLLRAQHLTATGVLNANIPSVRVTGAVTVNGAAMADESAPRGQLLFALDGGGTAKTPSFGGSGSVTYGLTLVPGLYAVRFDATPTLCSETTNPPRIPCVSGTLFADASLTADGVFNVDIPARTVRGAVTLSGAALPEEHQSRGAAAFTLLDTVANSTAVSHDLGTTGTETYAMTVLPGRYVVSHVATPALCGPTLSPNVPCASQVVIGCNGR